MSSQAESLWAKASKSKSAITLVKGGKGKGRELGKGYSPPGSKHLVPGRWSMLQIPQGVSQLRYSHGLQVAWRFHTNSSFEWHRVEHKVLRY